MKPITGYEALMQLFKIGVQGQQTSSEAMLIDWAKARRELANPLQHSQDPWELFLATGLIKERVLQLVDLGIRSIVERMLDLGIITLDSCGGHVEGGKIVTDSAYVYCVFANPELATSFTRMLMTGFVRPSDWEFRVIGSRVGCLNEGIGPALPARVCLEHGMPVLLSWKFLHHAPPTILRLWERVAEVLSEFDGQGTFTGTLEQFAPNEGMGVPEAWFKELEQFHRRECARARRRAKRESKLASLSK